jgi:hypothetical protein
MRKNELEYSLPEIVVLFVCMFSRVAACLYSVFVTDVVYGRYAVRCIQFYASSSVGIREGTLSWPSRVKNSMQRSFPFIINIFCKICWPTSSLVVTIPCGYEKCISEVPGKNVWINLGYGM